MRTRIALLLLAAASIRAAEVGTVTVEARAIGRGAFPAPPKAYISLDLSGLFVTYPQISQNGTVMTAGLGMIRWRPVSPNAPIGYQERLTGFPQGSVAFSINDAGEVPFMNTDRAQVGIWKPSAPGSTSGVTTVLPLGEGVGPVVQSGRGVLAINSYGEMLIDMGYTGGGARRQVGFWRPDQANGTTGHWVIDQRFNEAFAMNEHGQILIDNGSDRAFTLFAPEGANRAAGSYTTIALPAGTESGRTSWLSSRGDAVGSRCASVAGAACEDLGFIWKADAPHSTGGTFVDIRPPSGYRNFKLTGVNAAGDAVGTMIETATSTIISFLYSGGTFYALPTRLPVSTYSQGQEFNINDAGQIFVQQVGGGRYLLTPAVIPAAPANAVTVTIQASVANRAFTVSGEGCQDGSYYSPWVLHWTPGAVCQVVWLSPQIAEQPESNTARRYTFRQWHDGSTSNPRTITTPASDTTYTGTFLEELFITKTVNPPNTGRIEGPDWAAVGDTVSVTPVASAGYEFWRFTSPRWTTAAPLTFVVSGTVEVRAEFAAVGPMPPFNYTVTTIAADASWGGALNNYGQVVGFVKSTNTAILWTPATRNGTTGSVTPVPFPSGTIAETPGAVINDFGQFATVDSIGALLFTPPYRNARGGDLSRLSPYPNRYHKVAGMNSYGQVFGYMNAGTVWTPDSPNGTTGAGQREFVDPTIRGFNDYGQFVTDYVPGIGFYTPYSANAANGAFGWVSLLPTPQTYNIGGMDARGRMVFTACPVVPTYSFNSCNTHLYVWRPAVDNRPAGAAEELPVLTGFFGLHDALINSSGEIAGTANADNRNTLTFLHRGGHMYELDLGFSTQVVGFNDAGQILVRSESIPTLFLLTPQPGAESCRADLSAGHTTASSAAGQVKVKVSIPSGCAWNAQSDSAWAGISAGASGSGNGTVVLDLAKNDSGQAREALVTIGNALFRLRQTAAPMVKAVPEVLRFRVRGGFKTDAQEVDLQVGGGGTVAWSIPSDLPALGASATGGTAPGKLRFTLGDVVADPRSWRSGTVHLKLTGAGTDWLQIPVVIDWVDPASPASAPFGALDSPADNSTELAGSIPVTGWALDDIQVDKVEIWRAAVAGETATGGRVYIGDATLVPDARPDVEAAYPDYPMARRAGWGYMLLSHYLPSSGGAPGNGTFQLMAIAKDKEGNQTTLGTRTISVNNAASQKPFGTIDTPVQGSTISGTSYVNFGWALTPRPASIPLDGSTIRVAIDGVVRGTVAYNNNRADIATLFPGYNNSTGAVGYLRIDTTTLDNGLHTIAWLVRDDAGHADGLGSRYFTVYNAPGTAKPHALPELPEAAETQVVFDGDTVAVAPAGRLQLRLGAAGGDWQCELEVGGERRPQPVGSTIDAAGGRFFWHVGPGFRGDYVLLFSNRTTEETLRVTVSVGAAGALE